MSGLGRLTPANWEHVERYPLSALAPTQIPKAVPCVIGVNWYSSFDRPIRHSNGTYWIGESANLGSIRGGHAICVKPSSMSDLIAWWSFYDQGSTGECVGFSSSRMMTLLNRARYDAPWLYFSAQDVGHQPHDPNAGTAVSWAMDVLRRLGHKTPSWMAPRLTQGISTNRWAQSVDEIRSVLASPAHDLVQAVPLLNSWGRGYPHVVWLPYTTLSRLLDESGECTVVTDR